MKSLAETEFLRWAEKHRISAFGGKADIYVTTLSAELSGKSGCNFRITKAPAHEVVTFSAPQLLQFELVRYG